MTKAVNMSNPSSSLTESPKESFGDAQTDFLDGATHRPPLKPKALFDSQGNQGFANKACVVSGSSIQQQVGICTENE